MNIELKRKKISQELGLIDDGQDWGIINSDYKRIDEFINYYYQHEEEPLAIKYDLLELIIASYNDNLLTEVQDLKVDVSFTDFIIKISSEINLQVYDPFQYWIGISNNNEFPVGKKILKIIQTLNK